jgi:disulfide bond formation protein DsbB
MANSQLGLFMQVNRTRLYFFAVFLFVTSVLGLAGYYQFVVGYQPCPLCILQRLVFIVIALIALVSVIHHPKRKGWQIYSILLALTSIVGMYFAGKQIWLHWMPSGHMESCGAGLNILLKNLPIVEALKAFFSGAGACNVESWTLLGLGFAEWAFAFYVLLFIFASWQFFHQSRLSACG